MQIRKKQLNKGLSIVELIFYVAIFTVLLLVVINSMIVMTKSYQETSINTDLTQSSNIMERLSRQIRNGGSISSITATSLKVAPPDSAFVPPSDANTRFTLSGTNIEVYDGRDTLVGNLNSPNVAVTALSFTQINTAKGTAIKIALTVQSTRYRSVRTESFYDTIVLRGDY